MTQPKPIEWTERRVAVSDLIPYEKNPRRISKEQRERLKKSILEDGYHQRALATPDLRLIGGHQRLDIFKELKLKEIIILVSSRDLTTEEFERILIRDNVFFGEFDLKKLGAFNLDKLFEWGLPRSIGGFLGEGEDPGKNWGGMPEFSQKDKTAFRTLPVHFKSQEDVDRFAALIGQKITEDTRSLWYPQVEIERYADKKYEGKKE